MWKIYSKKCYIHHHICDIILCSILWILEFAIKFSGKRSMWKINHHIYDIILCSLLWMAATQKTSKPESPLCWRSHCTLKIDTISLKHKHKNKIEYLPNTKHQKKTEYLPNTKHQKRQNIFQTTQKHFQKNWILYINSCVFKPKSLLKPHSIAFGGKFPKIW